METIEKCQVCGTENIRIHHQECVGTVEDISDPWQACRYANGILREQFSDIEIYSGEKIDISDMYISPERKL